MKRRTTCQKEKHRTGNSHHNQTYSDKQQQQQQHHQQPPNKNGSSLNMFSSALLNLSSNDRNQIEEEIHGVSCMAIVETPILLEVSLDQFDIELNLLPIEQKTAYIKVLALQEQDDSSSSSSYLLTKDMKLRFLRSELFDVSKSVIRYSKYLNLLDEIYGDCVLKRPIRLQEDFNPDELAFFKSGAYQLLPFRDRCGRHIIAVVINEGTNIEKQPQKLLSKVWLYLFFVCVGGSDISNNDKNNLETQQKGVVVVNFPSPKVLYAVSKSVNNIKDLKKRLDTISRTGNCTPVRFAAVHWCLPDSHIFKLLTSVYGTAFRELATRIRFHLGNPIEIRYKLQQFGIPIEQLPATDTGNIKSIYFKQWINLRTHVEYEEEINNHTNTNTNNNIVIVECPLSNDVIFRRGRTMNFHPGNVRFQNLIELHIQEHSVNPNTSLIRRKEIEIEILNEILNSCGRFLTWITEKKWWLVIHSEDEIQFKIYHAFLGFHKRMLKKQQKQQKVEPTIAQLSSLFEGQQVGQKKKRYNDDNSSCGDCGLY